MSRRAWTNLAIVVAIVAIVAISLVVGAGRGGGDFAGTDSLATQEIEGAGHTAWFAPVFEPGSAEIESGLFALQAALGGGVLGYCIGRLHGRHRRRAELSSRP